MWFYHAKKRKHVIKMRENLFWGKLRRFCYQYSCKQDIDGTERRYTSSKIRGRELPRWYRSTSSKWSRNGSKCSETATQWKRGRTIKLSVVIGWIWGEITKGGILPALEGISAGVYWIFWASFLGFHFFFLREKNKNIFLESFCSENNKHKVQLGPVLENTDNWGLVKETEVWLRFVSQFCLQEEVYFSLFRCEN